MKLRLLQKHSCETCGKEFRVFTKDSRFCSIECRNQSYVKRVAMVCETCGKEFDRHSYATSRRFCSDTCYRQSISNPPIEKTCSICGAQFITYERDQATCSKECGYKYRGLTHRGEKSPRWKDGSSFLRQRGNDTTEQREWRKAVFSRDNYTCRMCGEQSHNLHAHHVKEWAKYPELRFDIDNGLTVCIPCHEKIHGRKMGKGKMYKTCAVCGKRYQTTPKKSESSTYCSRECQSNAMRGKPRPPEIGEKISKTKTEKKHRLF